MISRYVQTALDRARYRQLDDGSFCATVPGLRGVIATAGRLESCRTQLAEVIEEWVLMRVALGLTVPPMGRQRIIIRKAS